MSKVIKLFIIILISGIAQAQRPDYTNHPGYCEFGDLSQFEFGDNVTEVIVEEHLLKMVEKMSRKNKPELASLLSGLKLIKVYSFDVSDKNEKSINDKINKINKNLSEKKWDRIVRAKEKNEEVNIFIKTGNNDDDIVGLVVTAFEKKGEAVFVNIVGKINLEMIGELSEKFDIPELDKIKKK